MTSSLVTGGFGFIGTHLVELLLKEPETRVHVVDNLSTSPIDKEAFIGRLDAGERFSYDITSVSQYFARADLPAFDEVFHLASVVGPVGVLEHSGQILRKIVNDTYLIADHALETGARLCDISTSEVYGGGREGYCAEGDTMVIPSKISARLEYAVGKLGAEVALTNLARVAGLRATIVRPFNVTGPRQSGHGGFVVPRFVAQALSADPLTVYGDGTAIRAFTHVRDIADGIIRVMRNGHPGEAYNIGNPHNKTTILHLAKRVIDVTNSESRIDFVDPKELWGPLFEEANDKYPDASRAMEELGWRPKHGLEETLKQTAAYIREGRCD